MTILSCSWEFQIKGFIVNISKFMTIAEFFFLHVNRKISVMDVSKKYGLEYRLLHSITKGHPWYGNWVYEFGAGSFALTVDVYKTAVETLSGLPLSIFLSQEQTPASLLVDVISHYQSVSEHELVNVGDLFRFVLSLLHDARKQTSSRADDANGKQQYIGASGALSSWSRRDVERVNESMLRVLRAVSKANWVSSRSLKGAVCKVASPELLDYCLQELGGKLAIDGTVVNARMNPDTRAFEYRLVSIAFNPSLPNAYQRSRGSFVLSMFHFLFYLICSAICFTLFYQT